MSDGVIPLLAPEPAKDAFGFGQSTSFAEDVKFETPAISDMNPGRTEDTKTSTMEASTTASLPIDAKRRKIILQNKFKPPLMLFNELYPGNNLAVEVHSDGPKPIFKASVTVNNVEYTDVGNSKQKAKTNVASKVLTGMGIETFPSLGEAIAYPYARQTASFSEGFRFERNNEPKYSRGNLPFSGGRFAPKPQLPRPLRPFEQGYGMFGPVESRNGNSSSDDVKRTIDREKAALHPTMVMIETFPSLSLNWVIENDSAQRYFVEANVFGQTFFGEARSKRMAKANLAKAILSTFYGVTNFVEEKKTAKKTTKHPVSQIRDNFPDANFVIEGGPGKSETESSTMDTTEEEQDTTAEESFKLDVPTDKKRKYTASLTVKGETFIGEGSSKMIAKTAAARKALTVLKDSIEVGLKRSRSEEGQIDINKHPCVMFNEIHGGAKFVLLEADEEDKESMFGWEVTINGVTFSERGPSKKKAKVKLAMTVFKELHGIDPNSWTELTHKDKDPAAIHLPSADTIAVLNTQGESFSAPPLPIGTIGDKNPVSVLHELNPSLICEFSEESFPPNKVVFCATISINGRSFAGKAASKKMAKLNAAKLALVELHGMDVEEGFFGEPVTEFDQRASFEDIPRSICDQIAQLVLAKESEVLQVDELCRVVAGFVLGYKNFSGGYDNFEVVSIGTGTKCVAGNQLGCTGNVVNDCHAEIIACRALRHFLYEQLEGIIQGKDSILEKSSTGRRKLKNSVDLFLYISTAPCGDGRVFVTDGPTKTGVTNKTAGLLRTKIENGQGTVPVTQEITQTSDGLIAGDRLLTMSCSDKIMKWNVTGVQGALLSLFVDPVYITGLIVGHWYHHSHLKRALNERCTGLSELPRPFKIQELLFGRTTHADRRDTSRTSNNSCNWYQGKSTSEVVVASSGKTALGTVSNLGKIVFFKKFCELLKKSESNIMPQTYHTAKKMATSYQSSKSKLYNILREKGYGNWVSKPVETDMFGF